MIPVFEIRVGLVFWICVWTFFTVCAGLAGATFDGCFVSFGLMVLDFCKASGVFVTTMVWAFFNLLWVFKS